MEKNNEKNQASQAEQSLTALLKRVRAAQTVSSSMHPTLRREM